jgi:hypothetical protein
MKNGNSLKKLMVTLVITNMLFSLIGQCQAANIINSTATSSEAKIMVAKDSSQLNMRKQSSSPKSSYEMDGSTSASKLVAKRSHGVSKHDETGLAIFLGVIVIGVIVFFLKPFSKKK